MRKIISTYGKYLIIAGIILMMLQFRNHVQKTPLLADDHTEYAKAVVLECTNSNLLGDSDIDVGDSQEVVLKIKSGTYKGKVINGYSLNGYLYGADCREGTRVIVNISESNGTLSANVYNYDRETDIAILLFVFLGLMWLIGGKKGINSILALLFTFMVIVFLYIPLMYVGCSPFLAATISVVLITLITFLLIADIEMKSFSAMIGTIGGVIVAGIVAMLFGKIAHVTGVNVDQIETLVYIGQNSKLNISGMLFSGILIASLGAVMDVSMSVATSLNELKRNAPEISNKQMFQSGINIGRDMIGTMSNTLILAYVGSSINLIMIVYAYSYSLHQVMSMYSVAIELMRGISGTIGIILTVPLTSLVTTILLGKKKNERQKEEQV